MKSLTVFTPTYNRAHCLDRLYKSLCDQTSQDFLWLIVDDGSTDNTHSLVESWISEQIIEIQYIYKKNGGMHTAHNIAYQLIETEINTCIDSDDYMPSNAVSSILDCWQTVRDDHSVAGVVGLDQNTQGQLIGSLLPADGTRSKLGFLYRKHNVFGDKKLVYRSSITKAYPRYPEFPEEKLVPLSRLYTLIDRDYDIICFNQLWVTVDYQPNGSSGTIFKQYFQSPKGFREARSTEVKYGHGFFHKIKNMVHLGTSCIILKDYKYILKSPLPLLTITLLPLSLILYHYFSTKTRQTFKSSTKQASHTKII